MGNVITSAIAQTRNAIVDAVETSANAVKDSVVFCGRTFENLTEKMLPHTAAKIVQKVVYGLPFAAFALMVPAYLQLAAIATYAIVHIAHGIAGEKDSAPFSRATYQNLFTGLGTAHLIRAGHETVKLATQQKASIVAIAINCLISSFYISRAVSENTKKSEQPTETPVVDTPIELEEAAK